MATRVRLHPAAIADLARSEEAREVMESVGPKVAKVAARNAPKRTGAGAASIHAELVEDADGLHSQISWDAEHDYMRFAELGTEREPARPFLRPAINQHYTP